jgi:23S rRNA (guanosine2251-2'-O)-methyltransferase
VKDTAPDVPVPGVRAVEALLRHAPGRIRRVLYRGAATGARGRVLDAARQLGLPVESASEAALERLVGDLRHQGVVAVSAPADYVPWNDLLAAPDALLVAADEITDPRNLGAILRAAEALGGTGALLTSHRCARLGPTVTRTSAGASELIPVAMEVNLARALRRARDAGVRIVGADLDGAPPDTIDLTGPVVLVIGAEGEGLRRITRDACDAIATIPLTGSTESLNASTAASILLYEAVRQRRGR